MAAGWVISILSKSCFRKQVFADWKGQAQKGYPAHMQQPYIAALLSVGQDLRQVL
jgi:hypothetical protein